MKKKAEKLRKELKNKVKAHKRQVKREKNREKTCLVDPKEISKNSTKPRKGLKKTAGKLTKGGKPIKKVDAVKKLGKKKASNLKKK